MTPQEIRDKAFDKGMSGYRAEEVRAFLDKIADYVEGLQNEKIDLQNKMEVLAEKIEEYREDEESLRAALIGAQKLGDSVVRESKKKAEVILEEATRKAESLVSDARGGIHRERQNLAEMQREVARFKGQILAIYKQHIKLIQGIPCGEEQQDPEIPEQAAHTEEDATSAPQPEAVGLDLEEEEGGNAQAALAFDDLRASTSAMDAIDSIGRRKSAKFGPLSEYFGDNNPIHRKG